MKQRMQNKRREQPRINYVSEDSDELEDDEMVLQVEGTGVKPFMKERQRIQSNHRHGIASLKICSRRNEENHRKALSRCEKIDRQQEIR